LYSWTKLGSEILFKNSKSNSKHLSSILLESRPSRPYRCVITKKRKISYFFPVFLHMGRTHLSSVFCWPSNPSSDVNKSNSWVLKYKHRIVVFVFLKPKEACSFHCFNLINLYMSLTGPGSLPTL
jgi:hypothetical protein